MPLKINLLSSTSFPRQISLHSTSSFIMPEAFIAPIAARLFAGGSRKEEMRDCQGIKILLAIYPSSHRGKDLLP